MREGFRLARTAAFYRPVAEFLMWLMASAGKRWGEECKDEEARGTITIIINFTDTIGYIVYIYSVLLATRRSYLPSRQSEWGEVWKLFATQGGGKLCLQVQKATMICDIKIQGRLKLQNVSVRLIKNNPMWKNNRAPVLSSRSYFSIGRDRNNAIICTNWVLCLVWKINGELLLTVKIKKWERKVWVWKRKRERDGGTEKERHFTFDISLQLIMPCYCRFSRFIQKLKTYRTKKKNISFHKLSKKK